MNPLADNHLRRMPVELNERQLFARIAQGDEAAFTQVFHRYNRRLYPFILKMVKAQALAEEIVQTTFIKLWTNRHTLSKVENPQTYIFTIAANNTRDYLKKAA